MSPRHVRKHRADWFRFLRERHLLIVEWTAEGKTFEDIAQILSMDPVQVQLISMTPIRHDKPRYAP